MDSHNTRYGNPNEIRLKRKQLSDAQAIAKGKNLDIKKTAHIRSFGNGSHWQTFGKKEAKYTGGSKNNQCYTGCGCGC
jgi:hypothetical protein